MFKPEKPAHVLITLASYAPLLYLAIPRTEITSGYLMIFGTGIGLMMLVTLGKHFGNIETDGTPLYENPVDEQPTTIQIAEILSYVVTVGHIVLVAIALGYFSEFYFGYTGVYTAVSHTVMMLLIYRHQKHT